MVLARGVSKRGQVTLFIIIALIVVAGIALFFFLKSNYTNSNSLNKEVQPVYEAYLSCLESDLEEAVKMMGYQGGYLNLPEFVPGSLYRPTSSQLDLFGQPIAYWNYISGNNIPAEQVPSKKGMEEELEIYINKRLGECDLSIYKSQGIFTYAGNDAIVDVDIEEDRVSLSVENGFNIYTDSETYVLNSQELSIPSPLGKFYNLAVETYEKEKQYNFLENYALDALWTSSPVIGVDFTCEPRVFIDELIRENLSAALASNIGAIKLKGNYYTLNDELNKYFVVDVGETVDNDVNFMYSSSWPTKIEITGEHVVNPVGIQEGLELLGFCYLPYHLVYDIDFPVMIQFFEDDFVFQFPVLVSIQDNEILNLTKESYGYSLSDSVCEVLNKDLEVYTYDYDLNPIETRLQYECMGSLCEVGSTFISGGDAVFDGAVPGCVNGKIIASAEGYVSSKYVLESLESSVVNILLKKKYPLYLDLGDSSFTTIYFESDDYSTVVNYPQQDIVELVEGEYNISLTSYSDTSIELTEVQDEVCVEVPVSVVGEMFDLTEEQCYPIENPQTEIDMAVIGGGAIFNNYITESELKSASTLRLIGEDFGLPESLEDLQENYLLLDSAKLEVEIL